MLIKEPADFQYKEYRSLEKIDILALLTVGDFDTDKEELKNSSVSYIQAMNFVKVNTFFYPGHKVLEHP